MSAAALQPRAPHPADDPRVFAALVEVAVHLLELTDPHLSTATPGPTPIAPPTEGIETEGSPPGAAIRTGTGVVAGAGTVLQTEGRRDVESASPLTTDGRAPRA